eukprot:5025749-Lingulodinium_polyedra.AAC.1
MAVQSRLLTGSVPVSTMWCCPQRLQRPPRPVQSFAMPLAHACSMRSAARFLQRAPYWQKSRT